MPSRRRTPVHATEIWLVFRAWRATRPPGPTLTADRRDLIEARLGRGYTTHDLVVLIHWFNYSDDDDPRWMRGDNPREREYLDLENLFRVKKLSGRIDKARTWHEGGDAPEDRDAADGTGLDLGPMGAFLSRRAGV